MTAAGKRGGRPRSAAKTKKTGTAKRRPVAGKALLRGIIESATSPIFCLDSDLRYVAFNDAHARSMSDFSGSTIALGDAFLDRISDGRERDAARANMARALRGEAFTLEIEIGDELDSKHILEVDHYPVRDEGGRIAGVAIFSTDITERRLAGEAVRTYAQQLRTILDTLAVGVVHARDRRIVWMNAAFGRIFGVGEEMLGATTKELFLSAQEYAEFSVTAYPRLALGETFSEERRMRRSDASVRWMRLTGHAIDPARDETDSIWVIEDIHEHREVVAALRTSDELLRKLSERVPGLLYRFQHFPDGRFCMPYASERIRDVFGTTPESVRQDAMAVFKVIHPDDFPAVMKSIDESARTLEPWRHEFRVRLGELGERWMLGDSQPERLDDGSVLWHGYVTDITELKRGAQVLADSEKRYRALFDTNPSPIWVYDLETLRVLAVNEAAILHYGYARDEFLAMTVKDIRPPEEIPALLERAAASKEGRIDHASRWRHRTRSGADIVVESTSQVVAFDGRRAKIVVINDVTERLRAEEQIRLAEKVFDNSRQAIMITDPKSVILRVNRAFERITGYSQEEVVGRSPGILSSGRQGRQFYADLWRSLDQGGVWEGELWNRRKSGEVYPEYLAISAVRDRDGNVTNYVGIFQDIGERKSAEERIQFLAHHDVLTGLPNRSLLRDRAEMALHHAKRQGHRVAILFIDLDRFKTINDSLGHEIGDVLLKQASERILATVRAGDTVCRLGGDEFVVLLPDVDEAEDAERVADKLIAAVNRPYLIDSHELLITCSAGIAIYPEHGGDIDTLQRNADAAMYAAKNSGRNTSLFYSPEMNAEALEYLTMENGLRRAVERDELFLEYQPQVDLADGRIVGMEALIRWRHPERGVLMPGVFIGIAEESGLIGPIGTWVLRRACEQMRDLARLGVSDLAVAVNVSAIQFGKPDFVQQVRSAIEDAGVSPAMLELEVTEGVIMRGSHPEIETLRQLDELGLQLSIDDFGTGYSSLSYLKRFEVDKLKIDQSFIRDLAVDPEDAAIVRSIIQMAHSLGLRTIAEGVEHEPLLHYLRIYHCDEAQGFHFGYPMPADEFAEYLARDSRRVRSSPGMH